MTIITAFSHLSVQVRDIDKVLPFYRYVFGLHVSVDREQSFSAPGPDGRRIDFRRREVYLRWADAPGSPFIVLGQHLNGEQEGGPTPLQGIGFDHVAFYVTDVDAVVERARESGARMIAGPKNNDGPSYGHPGEATVRTALFYDPEGNVLQIDRWLDTGSVPARTGPDAADGAEGTDGTDG
ncbi:glyoxalase/bleomycin resistance/dioxygenase family protein [Streptomyces sp. MNU77]|uniref:VOC family protein n=1 Tax=Streptomyces sp. MNU77 TaxID=1573406 RepID=UPI0005DDCC10|nr:VOC family protein [Streptomyces sp. MNU77]OLO25768.1 glyoxalase/bleomycin resistance/dioxygenase family protein [Streptomyces sp. MNU77]